MPEAMQHLEGRGRGAQRCSLLGEQARELGARLCELRGDGVLLCQGQVTCWEAIDPLCRPAGACTPRKVSMVQGLAVEPKRQATDPLETFPVP